MKSQRAVVDRSSEVLEDGDRRSGRRRGGERGAGGGGDEGGGGEGGGWQELEVNRAGIMRWWRRRRRKPVTGRVFAVDP